MKNYLLLLLIFESFTFVATPAYSFGMPNNSDGLADMQPIALNMKPPIIKGEWFVVSPSLPVEWSDPDPIKSEKAYYCPLLRSISNLNPAADTKKFIALDQYFMLGNTPRHMPFGEAVRFGRDPMIAKLMLSMNAPGDVFRARCPVNGFQGRGPKPNYIQVKQSAYGLAFNRIMLAACIKRHGLDKWKLGQ